MNDQNTLFQSNEATKPQLRVTQVNGCPSVRFHNVDCMEFMKTVPDKFYDLAIVDVPYGIGFDGYTTNTKSNEKWKNKTAKVYTQKSWDVVPEADYFTELFRVSQNQIIWGANHFISRLPIDSSCWIVWDKETNGNFSDCELAWTSFDRSVKRFKWLWDGFKKHKPEERIHPTQKPIALYRWVLQTFAINGMRILDTHGGSMSSAIACDMEGFDLDICEIDSEYFQKGVQRFQQYKSQKRLF